MSVYINKAKVAVYLTNLLKDGNTKCEFHMVSGAVYNKVMSKEEFAEFEKKGATTRTVFFDYYNKDGKFEKSVCNIVLSNIEHARISSNGLPKVYVDINPDVNVTVSLNKDHDWSELGNVLSKEFLN